MKKTYWLALSFIALLSLTDTKAITCYAITDADHLLTFDSAAPDPMPQPAGYDRAITGLGAYHLLTMAMRTTSQTITPPTPGVGSLWALGYDGASLQWFQINPANAWAAAIGAPFNVNMSGVPDNGWGLAFNPATDTFRLIGFTHNYAVNANTLGITTDTNFTKGGLPLFPAFCGAAFTTASYGGTSKFYCTNSGPNDLETSANIATGVLVTVGMDLGQAFNEPGGMSIAGSLALFAAGNGTAKLFNVNLSAGTATVAGSFPAGTSIRGLAIKPTSFPPVATVTVKVKGKKKVTTAHASLTIKGTASSQAGIALVQYKIGKGKFKAAKGTTSWKFKARLKPGANKIQVQATGSNGVSSSIAKIKVTLVK